MNNRILVGSNYFFKNYNDFQPKDTDYVLLVDNPSSFYFSKQTTTSNTCLFEWRNMSPRRFINFSLKNKCGMELGKFLVPEFCNAINFDFYHLQELRPLLEYLDNKHRYLEVIYNAYMDNKGMYLTDEQRDLAYAKYKEARNGV